MRDARIIRGLVSTAAETPEDHTLHDYIYVSVTHCFAWKKFASKSIYLSLFHAPSTANSFQNPVKRRCLETIQCYSWEKSNKQEVTEVKSVDHV